MANLSKHRHPTRLTGRRRRMRLPAPMRCDRPLPPSHKSKDCNSMALRRPLNPSVSKLRSGVTNDPYRLPGVDMGGAYGRRFRDLVQDLASEFGGVEKLSTAELLLVRQA